MNDNTPTWIYVAVLLVMLLLGLFDGMSASDKYVVNKCLESNANTPHAEAVKLCKELVK